ncbi:hypothetical protein F511_02839 [Dorcoceras hygrometricum]|uniref:Uncharacterized protein n=1 Tax=Dorcoceras hygrometricum TaxID=472368 RepID=A0A2Z7AIS1_9LAMI|nr:hypothetical protein F511_02839 [Dorcoceras hygrometricum]
MEDPVPKEQSSVSHRSASRLLRYPLRSATKSKEEKPPLTDSSNTSAIKSARPASSVSKSVNVLDISGKEKSARPPRRFSIPSKSSASSATKSFGNITPISEARGRRFDSSNGKIDTPVSDVSRSSSRKKFSTLSSASYWLSQIKLAESANKHSVSLGFFKLALEAGCEPMQRMKDEFKAYVQRHDMSELGESTKELIESYKILEGFELLQISGTSSQLLLEVVHATDDDVHGTSSTPVDAGKLQPKAVGENTEEICQVQKESKEVTQKNEPMKNRKSKYENMANSQFGSGTRGRGVQKKTQKSIKQDLVKEKDTVKKQGKKATEEGHVNSPLEEGSRENKENVEVPRQIEVVAVTD